MYENPEEKRSRHGYDLPRYQKENQILPSDGQEEAKLVCIPTTAGTGSEVTSVHHHLRCEHRHEVADHRLQNDA